MCRTFCCQNFELKSWLNDKRVDSRIAGAAKTLPTILKQMRLSFDSPFSSILLLQKVLHVSFFQILNQGIAKSNILDYSFPFPFEYGYNPRKKPSNFDFSSRRNWCYHDKSYSYCSSLCNPSLRFESHRPLGTQRKVCITRSSRDIFT